MFTRSLSQWAFAIFVTVGANAAVAQGVSIVEAPTQTMYLRPGFQQEIMLRGNARVGTIHVGDDTVARVTAVSDTQFVITAEPNKDPKAREARQTSILVRDRDQKVLANLEVVVGAFDAETHEVVLHRPLGSGGKDGVGAKGMAWYQCSSVKCYLVSEEKAEAPTVSVRRDETTTTTSINTNTNKGP